MSKNRTKLGLGISICVIILVIIGAIVYSYNRLPTEDSLKVGSDQIIEPTGPKIVVSPASFDLGTVVYGDVSKKTIMVKNIGDEPLEIIRLSTSCGCTEASIADEDKIIPPGRSVEMLVSFDPAVHKDDTSLGKLTRIIYLKTNDKSNPEIEVELQANVVKKE